MAYIECPENICMQLDNISNAETDDGSIFDKQTESLHLIPSLEFCPNCQKILDNLPRTAGIPPEAENIRLSHYNSITELRSSANDKCCLCVQFLATDNAQDLPEPLR